jgi:hypothetical protein
MVLGALPTALNIDKAAVEIAIRETAEIITDAGRRAAAESEAAWRASFIPHAYLIGTQARPSQITIYGLTGGAERWLKIPLDLLQPPVTFVAQARPAFWLSSASALHFESTCAARLAVVIGGLTTAAGHFMLTFEPLFYPALTAIALGNGLYLPSLPSQIAGLYREDDPRRAGAYNVYYVGVNLGGFLAPLRADISARPTAGITASPLPASGCV